MARNFTEYPIWHKSWKAAVTILGQIVSVLGVGLGCPTFAREKALVNSSNRLRWKCHDGRARIKLKRGDVDKQDLLPSKVKAMSVWALTPFCSSFLLLRYYYLYV